MRIGVDIDGVLTNIEEYMFDHGVKFFKEKGYDLKNPFAYYTSEQYEVPKEYGTEFWKEFTFDYFSLPPRKFAVEVLKKLQDEGNEIIIITARGSGEDELALGRQKSIDCTLEWLEKFNIKPSKIFFERGSKLKCCKENKIDVMIEDSPTNLTELSKEFKCIAYNCLYNMNIKNDNVIRCYSWYDIYYKIQELKEK